MYLLSLRKVAQREREMARNPSRRHTVHVRDPVGLLEDVVYDARCWEDFLRAQLR